MNKNNDNYKLNTYNFTARKKIAKIKSKMLYTDNVKVIWGFKDSIKELEHRILINEQQVIFNLMTSFDDLTE